jgi:hypothetical protein
LQVLRAVGQFAFTMNGTMQAACFVTITTGASNRIEVTGSIPMTLQTNATVSTYLTRNGTILGTANLPLAVAATNASTAMSLTHTLAFTEPSVAGSQTYQIFVQGLNGSVISAAPCVLNVIEFD